MRWTPYRRLVFLYLVIFLLAIGSFGASPQLKDAPDRLSIFNFSDANPADTFAITNGDINGTVDVLIKGWRGFATKDEESIPFRLNVETIRVMDPGEARRLLASNMSIEQIKSQARAGERNAVLRGHIRLNNDFYRLTDITLTSSGTGSTLGASVARSGSEDVASNVGHTVVTFSVVDELEVANGYIVIDDSNYNGNYSLLLNECPGRGPGGGMMGRG
jgi:hypothetical protein